METQLGWGDKRVEGEEGGGCGEPPNKNPTETWSGNDEEMQLAIVCTMPKTHDPLLSEKASN